MRGEREVGREIEKEREVGKEANTARSRCHFPFWECERLCRVILIFPQPQTNKGKDKQTIKTNNRSTMDTVFVTVGSTEFADLTKLITSKDALEVRVVSCGNRKGKLFSEQTKHTRIIEGTHTHAHTHTHTHTHTHAHTHTHTHTHAHTRTHARTHTRTNTHTLRSMM